MNGITVAVLIFSILGAADYLFGNKIGIGKEFQKAFSLFCPMALSMIGMLVVAPALGAWLMPAFEGFYRLFGIDPSILPACLFANDMGGMQLAQSICKTEAIGDYNAFVVSSMLGCVMSFTIPFSLGMVKKEQHKDLFFGLLCGIATIPMGSIVAGLLCGIGILPLLINLIPLVILSVILIIALVYVPKICIKCFSAFGTGMKALSVIGLAISIFTFLTKVEVGQHFGSFEDAAFVCANACVTLSGALPLMFLVSKLLKKPLHALGAKIGINGISALSFLGSLVTNASTFGVMDQMDQKGVVLNGAFAVSASFVFGSHLAFTMAFDSGYVLPVIVGKIVSGVAAVILAMILYRKPDTAEK